MDYRDDPFPPEAPRSYVSYDVSDEGIRQAESNLTESKEYKGLHSYDRVMARVWSGYYGQEGFAHLEQTDGLAPYDFDNNSPGIEVEEYSENNSGLDPSDGRHAAEFAKAIPGIGAGMSRADTATADIVGKTENGSLTAYDVLIAGAEYTQAEFSIGGAVAKDLPKI